MAELHGFGFTLAGLLESHVEGRVEIACTSDDSLPDVRLKGWRVLEEVSVGPDVYLLLRRIRKRAGSAGFLTSREYDAALFASSGASNKEIAHQMGISASTVGVLLWRACRKIGVTDRDGLIRIFTAHQF